VSASVQWFTAWDRATFHLINEGWQCPTLDRIMPPISDLGLGYVQVPAILALAIVLGVLQGEVRRGRDIWSAIKSRKDWVVPLLVAFALSGLGSIACKSNVPRDRPYWFYLKEHQSGHLLDEHVHRMPTRRPLQSRGFVSGHTATSVAIAMAVTVLFWKRPRSAMRITLAWALAILISLSRIYIADHWPLDVVCGTILGIVSGWLAVYLARRLGWIGAVENDAVGNGRIAKHRQSVERTGVQPSHGQVIAQSAGAH